MFDLNIHHPKGVLRPGWFAVVGDYARAGGWAIGGKVMIVGDAAGGVYAFDGTSGTPLWARRGVHEDGVLAVAIHPKGTTFATAGQDGRVLIWKVVEGHITHAIDVGSSWVENLEWSQDGLWLAASCSRQVFVYDEDGQEAWRSDQHPSTVSAIAWSSDRQLATACYGRVAFFNASNGELNQKLEWKGSLISMILSPNGDIVACGSQDNSVHFWRRSTEQDSMMSGYSTKPSALSFDDTGTYLATSGGEAVTVWSFGGSGPEGTHPTVLEFHVQPITALSYARRALRLASGSRDGAVGVWSFKNDAGKSIGAAMVQDMVAELHWRPDGRALAALDAHGGVTVWRVSS